MSRRIVVDLASQTLTLFDGDAVLQRCRVSTGAAGAGEQMGSYRTPRGRHVIRARIGAGLPAGTVLVGRRPSRETWSPEAHAAAPGRDWILSRILWLCGTQPYYNRFGAVDTMRRYVYLHGTHALAELGRPGSRGCIRLADADLLELFDRVEAGCEVVIVEDAAAPPSSDELAIRRLPARLARDAFALRAEVFQRELGVPAEFERDAADADAHHLVGWDRWGRPVAAARLLPAGTLGRVAVRSDWRGRGAGAKLVAACLAEARALGWHELRLAAEANAVGFWRKQGFQPEGEPFVEAGIAHQRMAKRFS
ncbi:GNAT family N-acetyltransferase [Chitinimonas koreensis]|uniref:GNAT family N-acetyltransferase n=1 Tax=Chitinimonas koreensis TaxID=356302 RepID=UPI0004150C0E|nr:GNAT family N-acetyltransferase [Chitinimonas koreensis]